ncbi:MAG: four helix bundle protein [Bacteroidota bacterium]|nr:four helix bundle protein [Bacteroidota bacterium]
MRKELEERLIDFSVLIFEISKLADKDYLGNYLINQLLRSTASVALNYGEAQSAETKKDFIHKIGVVLKELRESNVNLKILRKTKIIKDEDKMQRAMDESHQLVSIFYRTIQTAKQRQ